jgi:alkanesulfonate monooxygenase SsuD/methylene tetrahydromethanopterin reductase-like flavin-dependent oxidoreductase (luciferase family)
MGVGIGLGCAEFPFSRAAAYWRWIDMCEAGGVDSIWQTDRIVGHQPFLESMTTMAALAGRTRRMRFGMNVVALAFRDPVLLAKQCATIDMLSDGRLLPAFGIGSPLAPEWEALGMDSEGRHHRAEARAARPADVDRWLDRRRNPPHCAHRHRLAGWRRAAG